MIKNNQLVVQDIPVQVIRKDIKRLRLAVYPPDGQVRVSVPKFVSDKEVRQVVLARLDWIRQQQTRIRRYVYQPEHQFESGEQHAVFGQPCQLEVIQHQGRQKVVHELSGRLRMFVKPPATQSQKAKLLDDWYRQALKQHIPELLETWQPIMGKQVSAWGIKKMKTRWGSCNIQHARIWLNLELAKKPFSCLEYVLVHEMVHLFERLHNQRFKNYMDKFLPDWRERKEVLNSHQVHAL